MLLVLALLISWTWGLSRMLFAYPMAVLHPNGYAILSFVEQAGPTSLAALFLPLLVAAALAPFGEELFFRGFLMNLLIVRRGLWYGVLASSLVFGLFHWPWALYAAGGGFIFSLVYLRFGSLWPGILLHALYNAAAQVLFVGHLFNVKRRDGIADLEQWVPEILLSIAFVPLAVAFWRRFRPAP